MTPPRVHIRGFTLTELLFVLIVLAIFGLASATLFHTTITISRNAAQAQNIGASFDSTVAAMRADVWRATKIESDGPNLVKLTLAGRPVTWAISNGSIQRREDTGAPRIWTPPPGMSIAADNMKVIVRVATTKPTSAGEVWLTSQPLLVEEMTR